MVANYAAGGAAVSVLARRAGARLVVVDCGVAEPLPVPGVLDRRLGAGTASMLRGPAMPRESAVAALETGIGLAGEVLDERRLRRARRDGDRQLDCGCRALLRACGATPEQACGRGTGLDDDGLARKRASSPAALALNLPALPTRSARSPRSAGSSSACWPAWRSARPAVACPCSSTAIRIVRGARRRARSRRPCPRR